MDRRARGFIVVVGDEIYQPVIQTTRHRVRGGVGAVDGDVLLGELQEDALLGVCYVYGLETPEDEWVCSIFLGGLAQEVRKKRRVLIQQ